MDDRKEVTHDPTTQADDPGSSTPQLLRSNDPLLRRSGRRICALLPQVAGPTRFRARPPLPTSPVEREEAGLVQHSPSPLRAQVSLHPRSQAALVRPRSCQTQGAAQAPYRLEPAGSANLAGCHREPQASSLAGHDVRDRLALRGSAAAPSDGHRQPADGGACPRRQREISAPSHALAQAVGVAPHLRALAEAEGLAFSWTQAGGADAPVRDSADLPATAEEGGNCQAF